MEFFYAKKDFFQLKDLEKSLPKEKGITSMSVKEVVQSLVDDGMVDSDKIGTSIYFWAFPSKASQNRKRKTEELEESLAGLKQRKIKLETDIAKAKKGKEDTDERREVLEELRVRQGEKTELEGQLAKYMDSDPDVLNMVKEQTAQAKEAVNRWTDNVFSIKSWIKNKFYFEDSVIDKQFGIPSDFDYME